jgi:hypothetical protein
MRLKIAAPVILALLGVPALGFATGEAVRRVREPELSARLPPMIRSAEESLAACRARLQRDPKNWHRVRALVLYQLLLRHHLATLAWAEGREPVNYEGRVDDREMLRYAQRAQELAATAFQRSISDSLVEEVMTPPRPPFTGEESEPPARAFGFGGE